MRCLVTAGAIVFFCAKNAFAEGNAADLAKKLSNPVADLGP
jgi:hypothetical protein